MSWRSLLAAASCAIGFLAAVPAGRAADLHPAGRVRLIRVPDQGLQPQIALDERGTLHLVYYKGEPKAGNLFYASSNDGGATFSTAIPVNSGPASAVAAGSIRGAQIAAAAGRVHVAWNGSMKAQPKAPLDPDQPAGSPHNGAPMLYSRLSAAGTAFEPQRNLMLRSLALDGGGSVAADTAGNVYVAWHGRSPEGPRGEAGRQVWIAASRDGGKTFAPERPAWSEPTGACACCGLRVFAGPSRQVSILYRSARESVDRDIYLLASRDGETFRGKRVHGWKIGACPVSSMHLVEGPEGVLGAWETEDQVYFARLNPVTLEVSPPVSAPGQAKRRKHPRLAAGQAGETLLVWTEGGSYSKGGDLAWQIFDRTGRPAGEPGRALSIPAYSFGAALARSGGGFTILY
ncbi:MAG: hypothetical protein FJW37_07540 [Acidobacteria bacterium]|nr:hypothetical protein [Acidobacteriota bacterium]